MKRIHEVIPIVTVDAASFLIPADFQAAKIKTLCFDALHLLMRGYLDIQMALSAFFPWEGNILLFLGSLFARGQKIETVRITQTGVSLKLGLEEFMSHLSNWQPNILLMNDDCELLKTSWDPTILRAYRRTHCEHVPACFLDEPYYKTLSHEGFMLGDFKPFDISQRLVFGSVVTSRPVEDATLGLFYTHEGIGSLEDEKMSNADVVLMSDCECLTCQMPLTRAYLSHLLKEVPFLAKRYLSIHNLFYVGGINDLKKLVSE